MIDLDTREPGLVQTVTNRANTDAERLREHLVMPEVTDSNFERATTGRLISLAESVPTATAGRLGA